MVVALRHRIRPFLVPIAAAGLALAGPPRRAAAQDGPAVAVTELDLCIAAAERRDYATAERIGAQQAALLADARRRRPDDVAIMVTLARVISQCRLPAAELLQQGELANEAVELLTRAVELEPRHWLARYLLALMHYRAPAFLRRGERAAEQFDLLLALQGTRSEPEIFARPFEYRGLLWMRAAVPDSARAVWERGLALFPGDTALRARLESAALRRPEPPGETPRVITTATVTVRASRTPAPPALSDRRVIQRMDVLMAPGATGDLLQAMQLQGGSTLVGDGADLHARGGDPAETPTLLNGAPVLGTVRFESLDGSLFGVIDPQVVRSAQFSPGGFSVRVGDALSGVLEVETEGRPRLSQARVGLSSVTASATVQQPMGARRGGWLSTRLSHTGPMLWMNGRGSEYPDSPRSADVIGGLTFEPDGRTEVRVVALGAMDRASRMVTRADVSGVYEASGASGAAVAGIRHLVAGSPLLVRAQLALSGRSSTQKLGVLDRTRDDGLGSVTTDVEMQVAPTVSVRAGGAAALLARRDRGVVPVTPSLAAGAPSQTLDAGAEFASRVGSWVETTVERGPISVVGGVRADRVPLSSRVSVDPRVSVALAVGANRLHASVGSFHQGAWRTPVEAPSPLRLRDVPTFARHVVAGAEGGQGVGWRVNVFHKAYGDYVRRDGPPVDAGTVRGLELVMRRPAAAGRVIDGWLSYAATQSRVRLADQRTVPGAYDVTHAAVAVATWRPLAGTRVGVTTRLATGAPTTDVTGADSTSAGWVPRYEQINGDRLPTYARTDVRFTQLLPLSSGIGVLFVEAINVFDRGNVTGYTYDARWLHRAPVEQFFARRTLVVGVEWSRQ